MKRIEKINKNYLVLFPLIILLTYLSACGGITPVTSSRVYNNDTGVGYDTIQEAIDASNSGDTIGVSPGIYYENILFNNSNITVRSTNPLDPDVVAATIIDGRGSGSVIRFRGFFANSLQSP